MKENICTHIATCHQGTALRQDQSPQPAGSYWQHEASWDQGCSQQTPWLHLVQCSVINILYS